MAIQVEGMVPLLVVFDVPTAVAFYRDVIGFEVVNTSKPFSDAKDDFGWAMLRLGEVKLMLNNAYENNVRPALPEALRVIWHKDVILYFACPDVDGAYEYLRMRGVVVKEPSIAYYGMKQLNVTDPDGYRLCFQWTVE
ncbi:putative glyoxalase superfamily protein PhnB [Granulicella aggregans]|uniref:Putative glyoxalase superfamily protein PhnB n=1 Tax=Granulicella aggregans TaxID=474949 RepID=A0A7W7ZAE6_9BACT|nr:VOC family protein [Granulicella aggregans]MBB5056127.1 putative glyoxalase superfamily protein PhnB [Granulicella aggregans]